MIIRTLTAVFAAAALTLGWQAATASEPATPTQPTSVVVVHPLPEPPVRLHQVIPLRVRALRFTRRVRLDGRFGRIIIPAIGVNMPIREGISIPRVLDRGVGHYPWTTVPGLGGTVGLPGHDVTPVLGRPYGPFHDMNRLHRGDRIIVVMAYGTFAYRVTGKTIVQPEDHRAFRDVGHDRLVLSMCWPRFTADKRYLVLADVVGWHD